jgi:hypothetical protein
VYGAVPPTRVTLAVPLPPLHGAGVFAGVAVNAGGAVMVIVCVLVQPLASLTVTVYEPAVRLLAVAVVEVTPPLHE